MTPVLETSAVTPDGAWVTWFVTSSDSSPSPYRSSVAVCAPASTTCPSVAEIVPEFATLGATKAARPALAMVIVPSLTTRAFGAAGWLKFMDPAMKSASWIPAAVTIRPDVLTCAPR